MNNAHDIREYIDPDSNRRLVSVSYRHDGKDYTVEVPFQILADDLLGFLADCSCVYGDEVVTTDGFKKFAGLILKAKQENK